MPFYFNQWKWNNSLNLQGMQQEKASINQCILTLIFQHSRLCQFSKNSHFSAFPKHIFHMLKSIELSYGIIPFGTSIFIHFSLMWPSLRYHRLASMPAIAIATASLGLEVIYKTKYQFCFPQDSTKTPFITFRVPPTKSIAYTSSSSYPTKIRFLFRLGICRTFYSIHTNPLGSWICMSHIPIASKAFPSAKYTLLKSPST